MVWERIRMIEVLIQYKKMKIKKILKKIPSLNLSFLESQFSKHNPFIFFGLTNPPKHCMSSIENG